MIVSRRTPPLAGVVIIACAGLLVVTGRGQDASLNRSPRLVIQDTGLTGIDRGLREHDEPREPRGRAERARPLSVQADGTPAQRLYRSGSVIVKFRDGTGGPATLSAMRAADASGMERQSYANFDIMNIADAADPETVAATLRLRDDVEYAQPRYVNAPMLRPNDPFYDRQWNFPAIDMERAWDIQPAAGDQITVAVLDTGVAFRTTTIRYS
jgi:hypothetical protein